MKAYINENGKLIVESESSTELYALKEWESRAILLVEDQKRKEKYYIRGSRISINKRSS